MSTTATTVGIKNSWSLISFAKSHGKMKVAPFVNKETGEAFKSCALPLLLESKVNIFPSVMTCSTQLVTTTF